MTLPNQFGSTVPGSSENTVTRSGFVTTPDRLNYESTEPFRDSEPNPEGN